MLGNFASMMPEEDDFRIESAAAKALCSSIDWFA